MTTSFLLLLSLAKEPRCPSIRCGNLQDFGFPFSNQTYPECGMLIVDNCNEPVQKVQLWKHGPWYNIVKISQDNTITLVDQAFLYDFQHHSCDSFKNFAFPSSPFISFEIKYYETLFRCPRLRHSVPKNFSMVCNGNRYSIIYYNHSNDPLPILPPQCSPIQFPLLESLKESVNLQKFVTGSFTLKVRVTGECTECHYRGGACGSDRKGNFRCSDPKGNAKLLLKLGLAIVASAIGVGVLIVLAFCFREKFSLNSGVLWKKKTESYQNIEAFLRKHGHLALKRYSYSDIKKMTDSFKYKLGQGGYGDVYKGQLLDGHNVAVKVLHDTKGNGEEFINEVASISRTSHVNIVTFLGFCFEGGRRALIYEFVANGSLEKFIYEKNSSNTNQKLKWETLYRIAVGIARGLEYLHRGCSTRILHFDIKPHNILLDEDFCPKISDFGLAKICLHKQSIVSMTCARGTIGYIAPEVISRTFGEVSYKSDVYSYGMMVFEMTGGRKDENVGVNRSSETYFPHWIYKRFETDQELGLQGIENEEDREYAMKMMIVSLWCIQSNPSNRPTMSKVLEMLAGSLDSLQIPPKPF